MDASRLSPGGRIAAISAIVLAGSTFLDWFGAQITGTHGSLGNFPGGGGDAWQTLDVIPIVLTVTIVAALGLAAMQLSDADVEPLVPMGVIVTLLGAISMLLILYRIIDPPTFGHVAGVSVDATRKFGIFVGLIAAAGVAYGGYSAIRDEAVDLAPSSGEPQ